MRENKKRDKMQRQGFISILKSSKKQETGNKKHFRLAFNIRNARERYFILIVIKC